jgi:hypothetical protein
MHAVPPPLETVVGPTQPNRHAPGHEQRILAHQERVARENPQKYPTFPTRPVGTKVRNIADLRVSP